MPQIWRDGNKISAFYSSPQLVVGGILAKLRLPFELIERAIWLWPFLILSFGGAWVLARRWLPKPWAVFSGFIYLVNSYSLLIVGGGQMGVALGYAWAPWVFGAALKLSDKPTTKNAVICALVFSLQIWADLRAAYVTLIGVGVYCLFPIWQLGRANRLRILFVLIIVIAATILLQAFWIWPLAVYGFNPGESLGSAYTTFAAVKYFSFADFSHSLSLLHPNWPENIFGKIYFLQPEFLLIPILAFSSLLFVNVSKLEPRNSKLTITFFAILGLLGAFLSKGANPPGGEIYLWLFDHFSGFVMFRDPTKFYILIALSYAVLIPFSLQQFVNLMKKQNIAVVVGLLFIGIWAGLHREAFTGQLAGAFRIQRMPTEYRKFNEYLSRDHEYSRVLWVPERQRYGYFSLNHPDLSLTGLNVASLSGLLATLDTINLSEQLARLGVSLVVVPTDIQGDIFVTERKYDDDLRQQAKGWLRAQAWLEEDEQFKPLEVFKMKKNYSRFFVGGKPEQAIAYRKVSASEYQIEINEQAAGRAIEFSENFDTNWQGRIDTGGELVPSRTIDGLQTYQLPENFRGKITFYYLPQRYVNYGWGLSVTTLVVLLIYLLLHNNYAKINLWQKIKLL